MYVSVYVCMSVAIVSCMYVCMYVGIVEYGGDFVRTAHLTEEQWIKCILLGSLSLPLGMCLCMYASMYGSLNVYMYVCV